MPKRRHDLQRSNIDTSWFFQRFRERHLSLRKAAPQMGLGEGQLSRTLNGKREMRIEEAAKLAVLLNQDIYEVLTRAGMNFQQVTQAARSDSLVPVCGYIDATNTIDRVVARGGAKVPRPNGSQQPLEALIYQTAQTRADPFDGWVLYVEPYQGVSPESVGRLSAVKLQDGRELIGVVRRGAQPRAYNVCDYSGVVLREVQLAAAAPVHWIQP